MRLKETMIEKGLVRGSDKQGYVDIPKEVVLDPEVKLGSTGVIEMNSNELYDVRRVSEAVV